MIKKIFSYGIGGAIAAVIDLSILYCLTEFVGLYYLYSAIIAFLFSFFFGFYFQKIITFKSKSNKHVLEGTYFLVFQSIGLLINLGLLFLFVDIFGFNYLLVAIFNKFIIFTWNFLMNYFFNFNH